MDDILVSACTHELRELLTVWHGLEANPEANAQDYKRIRAKINHVCDLLDAIERKELKR